MNKLSSPTCRACGVTLNDENWYPSDRMNYTYYCKSCTAKKGAERHRKHIVTIHGHRIKTEKRPYPLNCELCGKPRKRGFDYHHWDDTKPQLGIWVCRGNCHWFCEQVDKGLHEVYLKTKKRLEKET